MRNLPAPASMQHNLRFLLQQGGNFSSFRGVSWLVCLASSRSRMRWLVGCAQPTAVHCLVAISRLLNATYDCFIFYTATVAMLAPLSHSLWCFNCPHSVLYAYYFWHKTLSSSTLTSPLLLAFLACQLCAQTFSHPSRLLSFFFIVLGGRGGS